MNKYSLHFRSTHAFPNTGNVYRAVEGQSALTAEKTTIGIGWTPRKGPLGRLWSEYDFYHTENMDMRPTTTTKELVIGNCVYIPISLEHRKAFGYPESDDIWYAPTDDPGDIMVSHSCYGWDPVSHKSRKGFNGLTSGYVFYRRRLVSSSVAMEVPPCIELDNRSEYDRKTQDLMTNVSIAVQKLKDHLNTKP